MPDHDAQDEEDSGLQRSLSLKKDADPLSPPLHLPKNRSTGNLSAATSKLAANSRSRFSINTGSAKNLDAEAFSPILAEHDHAGGPSGLRRIRQPPLSRVVTQPPSPEASLSLPPRSASLTWNSSTYRSNAPSTFTPAGPSSPTFNFAEDLSKFPNQSLHSFSFAHQSEDDLHSRQNLLKRSIDFMKDKLGWMNKHPGLVTAQAKVSGDLEIQSMMDLLARANLLGYDVDNSRNAHTLHGPLTGPADFDRGNVFEKAFLPTPTDSNRLEGALGATEQIEEVFNGVDQSEKKPELESPLSPTNQTTTTQGLGNGEGISGLKRTRTDLSLLSLQTKLSEALARPYATKDIAMEEPLLSQTPLSSTGKHLNASAQLPSAFHGQKSRWVPPSQAIFTTEAQSPWTILAANDLACLVFGVTKAEVKKLGILEIVKEHERAWLEQKIKSPLTGSSEQPRETKENNREVKLRAANPLAAGGGVTAKLLSKPSSREIASQKNPQRRISETRKDGNGVASHVKTKSRGVLLCGDVVQIQKRNGATCSASLWVKEKQGGLIWVLEEIAEDNTMLKLDKLGHVVEYSGPADLIWGKSASTAGVDIRELVPQLPIIDDYERKTPDYEKIKEQRYYAVRNGDGANIPASITPGTESATLRVSSFPHIAGIVVLSPKNLQISSSNSAFSTALFGQTDPNGLTINDLIPRFDEVLEILVEDDCLNLEDGIVIPEHSFRKASTLLSLRKGTADAASIFLHSPGLVAKHRDGSSINIDVQMRVVRSERTGLDDSVGEDNSGNMNNSTGDMSDLTTTAEVVYALWITYSRQLHANLRPGGLGTPILSKPDTPHHMSPGQTSGAVSPQQIDSDENKPSPSPSSIVRQQIEEAASQPISQSPPKQAAPDKKLVPTAVLPKDRAEKKKINQFVILEDLGQGAYGSVKLARYAKGNSGKVVLKYVTKRRILVDTWTRDRRLGTVPLEIHVLDYLRRDDFRHPNIVEMIDFFEDDINYYIEMVPHGLPGMDLFDYIEMRSNMDELECRNIFLQVVAALHHLHTKTLVVHRDIKDENIILDGENKVKLIDFGSAAYIKNGPFDVFVGTIGKFNRHYAAPEVLQGKSYRGKEQDVWALGILLYTLVYKENPFYSIDEIMDHELRIPWIMSEASIDLIKAMLNRDVDQRHTITQVMEHPWCQGEKNGP